MAHVTKAFFLSLLLLSQAARAEHVIVCGAPALRSWEDLRTEQERHDRWWANFVRASTLRMDQIRQERGAEAALVWLVYKPGYDARGREDGQPYTTWIAEQATKRSATLIWFSSSSDYISKINARPKKSVVSFDYFGHSNKYAFMFDYGSDIMAASTAWLHQNDISKLNSSIFAKDAICKSWGCHTGASMSDVWKKKLGIPLIGAKGKTVYTMVGQGEMPTGFDGWTR
jgi:hypothetical protein